MEELQTQFERAHGETNARGFAVGHLFRLTGFGRSDQNREYLVTAAGHDIQAPGYESEGGEGALYRCSFSAIESRQEFRPQRVTPKPIVQGPQTAIVTGPDGDEIHTDKYGRVKVQFHWDRYGERNENSSCWIRVSHPWAGKNWGAVAIPRIGQEVIVDFLEGDPDRPIITGRVYNAESMPPYTLPAGGVVSGIKSDTHKGDGYNEMSMDDTAGNEKITIHAQYDMNTTVEHDQTNTVKNTFTETITSHAKITVTEGTYSHDVQANTAKYHVSGDISEKYDSNQTTKVGQTILIVSEQANVSIKAATKIELEVGASKIYMDSGGKISVEGVNVAINGSTIVAIAGGVVHSEAKSEHQTKGAIVLSEGSATNTVKGGMVMLNP
jgi:type VI secretion system secreted protein VgrG